MDWIDQELAACHDLCRSQPNAFARYRLELPARVDRSRIGPSDNAYRFRDLEFRLSRDEVVRLLMTDKLYSSPHLCLRELLQNSLDALRYRKAVFASEGMQWGDGQVELQHFVDENGYEVVQCRDNGSGMDEEIIANHFVKIGRSFYRSPEFERERSRLRSTGNDFDPCSKFGIGFMSCFMLGDNITIQTRRDYGPGRGWGEPLAIDVRGLSGLLVIRDGRKDQPPGTTVSITCRRKPSFLDEWTDRVQLITVLKGYALATEFPIVGHCEVPELRDTIRVPPDIEKIPTTLEALKVRNCISLEQDLSQVDRCLRGNVRESILVDGHSLPCIENGEARWSPVEESSRKRWKLNQSSDEDWSDTEDPSWGWGVPVCIDGILVAGPPGRASFRKDVRLRLGSHNSGVHSHAKGLLDARGELKPEITPGRTPPEDFLTHEYPGWRHLQDKFKLGLGLLWRQLAEYLGRGLTEREFWRLVIVHGVWVPCIPYQTLWDLVSVSLLNQEGVSHWCKLMSLGDLTMIAPENHGFELRDRCGDRIGPDAELSEWEGAGTERPNLGWAMRSTTLLACGLEVRGQNVVLTPVPPRDNGLVLSEYAIAYGAGVEMFAIDYHGSASDALTVETPFPTANRKHPLTRVAYDARYARATNDLQRFATSFITCLAQSVSSSKESPSLVEPGYWQKRVAHLYFEVKWDRYANDVKPPYKIWTSNKQWCEFGEDDLARWRDSRASLR
jgi:hypothetical protein